MILEGPGRYQYDTNYLTYRCFLPDLTGFIIVCHAWSTRTRKYSEGILIPDSLTWYSILHKELLAKQYSEYLIRYNQDLG